MKDAMSDNYFGCRTQGDPGDKPPGWKEGDDRGEGDDKGQDDKQPTPAPAPEADADSDEAE
jgi:hypothetical protein